MAEIVDVDVAIIGGGLAGLSTALKLKDAGIGSYVILESEARLGGRTWTREEHSDFGGGYVGSAQQYIQLLIRRFQIPTIPTYLARSKEWLFQREDGTVLKPFPGNDPLRLPGETNALMRLMELDVLALEVRNTLPDAWKIAGAAQLDAITVDDWIRQQKALHAASKGDESIGMTELTAEATLAAVRSVFSLEPREISFFFLLYYAAAAGGFSALVNVTGGDAAAESTRFAFGTQHLLGALAAEVGLEKIQQSTKVLSLSNEGDRVLVNADAGRWRAKRVVVAMSPPASKYIDYGSMAQSVDGVKRAGLCSKMTLGRTIKGFVHFKDAFWRKNDRSGYLLSAGRYDAFPVDWTLDNTWQPSERLRAGYSTQTGRRLPLNRHSLMTFIVGDAATYWSVKPKDERARAVLAQLRGAFEFQDSDLFDSEHPEKNYEDENWPASAAPMGCPSPAAMMPPNTLTRFGSALRTPVGHIHWAGSESATDWCGYMNGAVESGFRAAEEVVHAISPDRRGLIKYLPMVTSLKTGR